VTLMPPDELEARLRGPNIMPGYWRQAELTAAAFDPQTLDVSMNGVQVCRAGGVGDDRSLVDLTAREVHVVVDLHAGPESATVWTNDLTHDYVHENSAYST